MTYKDFLELEIPAEFGMDDEYGTSEAMEKVFDQIPSHCDYRYGASQYVILIDGMDKVVKIPFRGIFYWGEDNEPVFEAFTRCTDYCEKTVDIYDDARCMGVADIFAKIELLGRTYNDDYPIYVQERIYTTYGDDDQERTPSNEAYNSAAEVDPFESFPEDWLATAIDYYGKDFIKKFVKFCERNCSDLHYENIGYREDGAPVVIDYAGFDS